MAAPIWNSRDLASPPFLHLPVTSIVGDNATIRQYEATVTDITTELNLLQTLETETWVFWRILQKYQNSERHMKWFRESKMICRTCERLLQLKLPGIAAALLPVKEQDSMTGSTSCRWPSHQMLQFFLVRLLGFSGLCQYIWSMGYKTNELLLQNMELQILFYRHFCKLSVISRMQVICQHLLEKSCKWYTALYPWLQCLPKLESQWLPDGVTLPDSVEDILGDKLKELRAIVSKSSEIPLERRSKSTLDKVFGSDPELLPRFVLEDDVTTRSAKMAASGPSSTSRVGDMSLDDIFDGLMEEENDAPGAHHSTSSLKLTNEKGDEKNETRASANHAPVNSVNGSATADSGMTGGEGDGTQRNPQKLQLEDHGVPVAVGDQSEMPLTMKRKKKKKRRKKELNNGNPEQSHSVTVSVPDHGDQDEETQQKLKRKRKHLQLEDPAQATAGGLEDSSRHPISSDRPLCNQIGQPSSRNKGSQITGKRKKKRRRKNKR